MTDLEVGDMAERRLVVAEDHVAGFARITGDNNPIHLDETFAAGTRFGARIAHGMLIAGYISATLAGDLPGAGTIYLGQTLRFRRPVLVGEEITVRVEVIEVIPEKHRAKLSTICLGHDGEIAVEGEATVMLPAE